jgi:hypothetical protein
MPADKPVTMAHRTGAIFAGQAHDAVAGIVVHLRKFSDPAKRWPPSMRTCALGEEDCSPKQVLKPKT